MCLRKIQTLNPYPVSMSAFSLAWSLLKEDDWYEDSDGTKWMHGTGIDAPWYNAGPYEMHDHHEWEELDPYGYGYGMDGEGTGFYEIFTDALRHELHEETPLESWQVRTPEELEKLEVWDDWLWLFPEIGHNPSPENNEFFEKLYHEFWPPRPEDSNL